MAVSHFFTLTTYTSRPWFFSIGLSFILLNLGACGGKKAPQHPTEPHLETQTTNPNSNVTTSNLTTQFHETLWNNPVWSELQDFISTAPLVIIIDKSKTQTSPTAQKMLVFQNSKLMRIYPISTGMETPVTTSSGKSSGAHTEVGFFRPTQLYTTYESALWDGALMNHSIFYLPGLAAHATIPYNYYFLEKGLRSSGGCIRMYPENAKELFHWILETGTPDQIWLENYDLETPPGSKHNKSYFRRDLVRGTKIKVPSIDRETGVLNPTDLIYSWDTVILIKDFSQ